MNRMVGGRINSKSDGVYGVVVKRDHGLFCGVPFTIFVNPVLCREAELVNNATHAKNKCDMIMEGAEYLCAHYGAPPTGSYGLYEKVGLEGLGFRMKNKCICIHRSRTYSFRYTLRTLSGGTQFPGTSASSSKTWSGGVGETLQMMTSHLTDNVSASRSNLRLCLSIDNYCSENCYLTATTDRRFDKRSPLLCSISRVPDGSQNAHPGPR